MNRLLLGAISVYLVGCTAHPPEATPTTIDEALSGKLGGKQVVLEGYPALSPMTMISDTMLVDLWPTPEHKGSHISFSLKVGVDKNTVERPPKDYKPEDLRIHTAEGELAGVQDRLRVNARLLFSTYPGGKSSVLVDPIWVTRLAAH